MSESEYTKLPISYTGYDKAGLVCSIFEYRNILNPEAKSKYKTSDGKDVNRLNENEFQIIENSLIIYVSNP